MKRYIFTALAMVVILVAGGCAMHDKMVMTDQGMMMRTADGTMRPATEAEMMSHMQMAMKDPHMSQMMMDAMMKDPQMMQMMMDRMKSDPAMMKMMMDRCKGMGM